MFCLIKEGLYRKGIRYVFVAYLMTLYRVQTSALNETMAKYVPWKERRRKGLVVIHLNVLLL